MKPICGRCDLFMFSKHNGEYFEERMPGPNGAKREVLPREFGGGMHCGICGEGQPCYGHPLIERLYLGDVEPARVKPGPLEGWRPYKLWVGDLWECRGCGAQVIVGVPPNPIAEHFQPEYGTRVNQTGVKRRIDDC